MRKQKATVNMDDKQRTSLLMKAIKDAEEGLLCDLGSFAKYAEEDED